MKLSKNLISVKKCPICQSKKFAKQGIVNGIHQDLKNLCSLIKCKSCKHLFLSKMPKEVFLKKLYRNNSPYVFGDEHVVNFKKNLKLNDNVFNHWIYKTMKGKKKGNYLEVGPGTCVLLKTFKKNGWKCEGFELSNWIKSKDVVHDLNKVKKGNKEVLVFNDVLEHTADPLSLLKKFSKFQNSGDRLFLSYPNASSFKAKILKNKWNMVVPLAHLNFFSIDSTKILLNKSGYYPLVIKETSMVVYKKLFRHIVRLPLTLVVDLLNFRISNSLKRILEIILNILDLVKGDQMRVIGIKK
jgi:hypothetical protein